MQAKNYAEADKNYQLLAWHGKLVLKLMLVPELQLGSPFHFVARKGGVFYCWNILFLSLSRAQINSMRETGLIEKQVIMKSAFTHNKEKLITPVRYEKDY